MQDCLLLKKSNCKNCYKCIRHCPVKSIRFSDNQAHIIGNDCILCGTCFVVCPQNAKEIVDGTEKTRELLKSGAPVFASLAPSFIANYEGCGIEGMRDALKMLGFTEAEETAVGAKIVKTEYERLLHEEKQDVLISSCCHSVNLLIQKYYPKLLPCLADVVSPMQAHSLDIKKRIPEAKTVFIGPCVAKKDEAQKYEGIVDAVLTFEELSRMLDEAGIIIEKKPDFDEHSKTRLFPTAGGILKTMEKETDYDYMSVDGVEECKAALHDIENGKIHKCFIEMSACEGSCLGGPIMEKYHPSPVSDYLAVSRFAGKKDFLVNQPEPSEIRKDFEPIIRKNNSPSEFEIRDILRKMGKTKPEDELNCGSCGYDTCREKAIAVFYGKAEISMCLPFLKERAESLSNTIVKNTPNGIIVLNEDLEVQQINDAACKILKIRSGADIVGSQIVNVLDPIIFINVLDSGKGVYDERCFLAAQKRFVEETVVCDRESKLLICILRDITDEENEKERKEKITEKTVEVADKVIDKQMRIAQEIALLLGETTAETKIALEKLKESVSDE